jgi:hypothetical protein
MTSTPRTEGWLWKLGKEHKVWRKRWCRVDGTRLLYWAKRPAATTPAAAAATDSRGAVDLAAAESVSVYGARCNHSDCRSNVMAIETRERTWLLSAETPEELYAWVDGLGQAIAQIAAAKHPPTQATVAATTATTVVSRVSHSEAAACAAESMKAVTARKLSSLDQLLPALSVVAVEHVDGEEALFEVRLSNCVEQTVSFRLVVPLPSLLRVEPVEGSIGPGATHLVTVRLADPKRVAKYDAETSLFVWNGALADLSKPTSDVRCVALPISFDLLKQVVVPSPRPHLRRPASSVP